MNRQLLIALLLLGLTAPPATAGDFMDTRLSFAISENNFFANPGETRDNSPGIGFGADSSNTLFFDNYDTKYSGFETLGHIVLYKKMPAFFEHLTTEASLVLRVAGELSDDGSYIRLVYDISRGTHKDRNLELVQRSFDAQRAIG